MNWVEFFFGWLVKGQMQVSALDYIMLLLEFIIIWVICILLGSLRLSIKEKSDKQRKMK